MFKGNKRICLIRTILMSTYKHKTSAPRSIVPPLEIRPLQAIWHQCITQDKHPPPSEERNGETKDNKYGEKLYFGTRDCKEQNIELWVESDPIILRLMSRLFVLRFRP